MSFEERIKSALTGRATDTRARDDGWSDVERRLDEPSSSEPPGLAAGQRVAAAIVAFVVFGGAIALMAGAFGRDRPFAVPPNEAPELTGTTLEGNRIDPSQFQGKTVVVGVWATWAVPSEAELVVLDRVAQSYASDPDVAVLGINLDDDTSAAMAFVRESDVSFDSIEHGQSLADALGLEGVPTTYVISPDGLVTATVYGAPTDPTDATAVEARVDELLTAVEVTRRGA